MPKNSNKNLTPKASEQVNIISNESLKDKIHTIRGQKVILDHDLAEIYGYETKLFNRQVKRNIERFEGEDFMFQLTKAEADTFLRCQNGTSKSDDKEVPEVLRCKNYTSKTDGRGGNRYRPYAFTEQGIYMLMTVLKGELAIRQSRALIRLFKTMKDYVFETKDLLEYRTNLQIAQQVMEHSQNLATVRIILDHLGSEIKDLNKDIKAINQKLGDKVARSELSPIALDFNRAIERYEYILMDGQPAKASEVFISLYARAKHSIYIIDNYISIKTLRHLQKTKPSTEIIIFSDNSGNYLHKSDYLDFQKEYPQIRVRFVKIENRIHDRFIILDYNTENEVIYHCGPSAKDAGGRMSAISKFGEGLARSAIHSIVDEIKTGKRLVLK